MMMTMMMIFFAVYVIERHAATTELAAIFTLLPSAFCRWFIFAAIVFHAIDMERHGYAIVLPDTFMIFILRYFSIILLCFFDICIYFSPFHVFMPMAHYA